MRKTKGITAQIRSALANLGEHPDLLADYVCECAAAIYTENRPIQWPVSYRARGALARLLIACGMRPCTARMVADKMSLRQMARWARRKSRK